MKRMETIEQRAYRTPELTSFGSIAKLTQGGSGDGGGQCTPSGGLIDICIDLDL